MLRRDELVLVVVEPDRRSLDTAARTLKLAGEVGLARVLAVANKVRGLRDEEFIRARLPRELPLLATIPFREELWLLDEGPLPPPPPEIRTLFSRLLEVVPKPTADSPP